MRDLSTLIIMFCAIGFASVGYANSQDPYSETLVSTLASRSAPIASMQEKAVNRLGDGAAVGLIRHIGAQTPATPHEIEGILFVVRMAFAAPEIISAGADREPKATLLLLSYLNYLPASSSVRGEVERTRSYVMQQLEEYKRKHAEAKN